MISIISLVLIFIENSLSLNVPILCVTLPFVSYIINRKKYFWILLIAVYLMISFQSDKYIYFLLIFSIYAVVNRVIMLDIDYNEKTMLYIFLLQLVFYVLISFRNFDIKYFFINLVGFILFNYIYIKFAKIKGK